MIHKLSGLFHFQKEEGVAEPPDRITPRLVVDDKVFRPILQKLYFEFDSPYHFGVLPVEILGTVYERFLGKVIRLTAGHQAKVEEKPEVRKAGGVYYTPAYIVRYIVEQTVGRQIDGKSPAQLAGLRNGKQPLRILDMACGSGSFLLGAYQCLLDHCLKWYLDNKPQRHKKAVYNGRRSGQWRLTIEEKKRLLTTHIFGVDIDPQAVEVSKLSLLLKVLEGEDDQSVSRQMQLFQERALPNLSENIKCGNSLIGPDYFSGRVISDPEELTRVNAFDWNARFPDAMKAGGFDCIIGNPPYIRSINLKEVHPAFWAIYRSLYRAASAREWDVYLIFVEKGLKLLTSRGMIGYILPNKFLNSQVGEQLRAIISEGSHLNGLVHFGAFQVFPVVTTYTCLVFLSGTATTRIQIARYTGPVNQPSAPCLLPKQSPKQWATSTLAASNLTPQPWHFAASKGSLLKRLKRFPDLESLAQVFQGTGTRADKVYMVEDRGKEGKFTRVYSHEKEMEYLLEPAYLKTALRGRSIGRYNVIGPKLLLVVPYEIVSGKSVLVPERKLARVAPRTLAYLRDCKDRLDEREKGRFKGEGWFGYGRPQNLDRFEVAEKIVLPDVADRGECFLDQEERWLLDTAYAITLRPGVDHDLRFILAILNSPVLTYFLKETGTALRGGYFRMKTAYLNPFPIPSLNRSNRGDQSRHGRLVILVNSMLSLHEHFADAKSAAQKNAIQRQIASTDAEIDRLVYELYGLTKKEIALVEEAVKR